LSFCGFVTQRKLFYLDGFAILGPKNIAGLGCCTRGHVFCRKKVESGMKMETSLSAPIWSGEAPQRGVRHMALVLICKEARAHMVETTAAAPPMSPRIIPIPSEGLIEMPPLGRFTYKFSLFEASIVPYLSKVIPLPTKTNGAVAVGLKEDTNVRSRQIAHAHAHLHPRAGCSESPKT